MRTSWRERGSVAIRLGRPHFAFYRGYLDGLDIGALADRYLTSLAATDTGAAQDLQGNLRRARAHLQWIRKQVQLAARRCLPPSDTRLLGMAPEALQATSASTQPSLEQFRDEQDPDGLFSESELIGRYAEAFPDAGGSAMRRAARNQRLRSRQQRALAQLERVIAVDPRPGDPVDAWLDATLAKHLAQVEIRTLAELWAWLDRHGYRWYSKVPKVGLQAALHIARWLQEDSVRAALGALPAHVLQPARSRRFQVECVVAPAVKDPVQAWMHHRPLSPHTLRAYRREGERFQLWALHERGKRIEQLTLADCRAYQVFLSMLGRAGDEEWSCRFRMPQSAWICDRGISRSSRFWKPFQGALSNDSQKQALIVIQGLMLWLYDQDRLKWNPFAGVVDDGAVAPRQREDCTLNSAEWRAISEALKRASAIQTADEPVQALASARTSRRASLRLHFIVHLIVGTGLRVPEICRLERRHLVEREQKGDVLPHWLLRIDGARGSKVEVPLGPQLVSALFDYLGARGLTLATMAAQARLVAGLREEVAGEPGSEAGLAAQRIDCLIKGVLAAAAGQVEGSDPALARRMLALSPRCLRLNFLSHEDVGSAVKDPAGSGLFPGNKAMSGSRWPGRLEGFTLLAHARRRAIVKRQASQAASCHCNGRGLPIGDKKSDSDASSSERHQCDDVLVR